MASIRSRRILKTDIRIVSKRGGAGAKAQNYVLTRPADGYTVMALTQTHLYTMARGKSNMKICLLYTSPSPRDDISSRMPSSA